MSNTSLSTQVPHRLPSLSDSCVPSGLAKPPWLWASMSVLCLLWLWLFCCLWPFWRLYENYQYGCFLPFLVVGLCWKRCFEAPEPDSPRTRLLPTFVAILAAVPLLPARMVYEANSLWRTISWPLGVPVIVITLCWLYLVGGRSWLRHFSFPFLFVLTALPWPGSFENKVTTPLALLNTRVTTEALFLFGIPALQRGTTVELANGLVDVDEACSGIRSFHSTLMLALLLGELFRLRGWTRLVFAFWAVVLALLFNVVRTFLLSWITAAKGLAGIERWHDALGVFVSLGCLAAVAVLAYQLKPKKPVQLSAAAMVESDRRPLRGPQPIPGVMCISLVLWLGIVEFGTRGWFRLRESNTRDSARWSLQLPAAGQPMQEMEMSNAVDRAYRPDEVMFANWSGADGGHWQVYYMRWKHGSKTAQLARAHWPEICLVNLGMTLRSPPKARFFAVQNLNLPFRTYIFDDGGSPVYVYHCVWEEQCGSASEIKLDVQPRILSRMQAAWEGKRNQGQQLLEVAVRGFDDSASAEAAFTRQLEQLIVVEKRNQKPEGKVQAAVRRQRSEAGLSTGAGS